MTIVINEMNEIDYLEAQNAFNFEGADADFLLVKALEVRQYHCARISC